MFCLNNACGIYTLLSGLQLAIWLQNKQKVETADLCAIFCLLTGWAQFMRTVELLWVLFITI